MRKCRLTNEVDSLCGQAPDLGKIHAAKSRVARASDLPALNNVDIRFD
jgi:hypothetical protein